MEVRAPVATGDVMSCGLLGSPRGTGGEEERWRVGEAGEAASGEGGCSSRLAVPPLAHRDSSSSGRRHKVEQTYRKTSS